MIFSQSKLKERIKRLCINDTTKSLANPVHGCKKDKLLEAATEMKQLLKKEFYRKGPPP